MAKISSLTDNTNDIIYPQTKANAVIMEDSSTVENAVNQRPKLILSASEPSGTIADNTLYGVYGDVGQITTGEIADSAVTTAKIASSSVTTTKLANGSVTSDKVDWTTIIDKIYPVGSIYTTTVHSTASAVKSALGGVGTWVAWGAGRVPVGVDTSQTEFDTVEKTGGEKTHRLTVNEMPSHKHSLPYRSGGGGGSTWYTDPGTADGYDSSKAQSAGGDQAHNNLQPYITCYMYKRTA